MKLDEAIHKSEEFLAGWTSVLGGPRPTNLTIGDMVSATEVLVAHAKATSTKACPECGSDLDAAGVCTSAAKYLDEQHDRYTTKPPTCLYCDGGHLPSQCPTRRNHPLEEA